MFMTETPVSILTSSNNMLAVMEKKGRKTVTFEENEATVVAHLEPDETAGVWYSGLELKLEKQKAKALAEHLHQTQPGLAQEIEQAYDFTQSRKSEGADQLFATWHTLGSGRRGLERFVLDKPTRLQQVNNTKASRSVVLNMQCLFKRSSAGAPLTAKQSEMIGMQYLEFTRPAQNLALIYAAKDEDVVKPYYAGEDDTEDDEDLEDLCLDDGVLSIESGSLSSRGSKSAKKLKKRSEKSSSEKKSKKSSSKKSSTSSGKSPMRRARNIRASSNGEEASLRVL